MKRKMRMGWLMVMSLFICVSLRAEAPASGKARLRELVVFPTVELKFEYKVDSSGYEWIINANENRAEEIAEVKAALKETPADLDKLLRLRFLLSFDDDTNEVQRIDKKAENLCRDRLEGDATNGSLWTCLGQAVFRFNNLHESEVCFRKAVQFRPNDWKPWAGLGSVLSWMAIDKMYDEKDTQAKAQAALGLDDEPHYRFTTEAARQFIDYSREAYECFDKAISKAPKLHDPQMVKGGMLIILKYYEQMLEESRSAEVLLAKTNRYAGTVEVPIQCFHKAAGFETNDPLIIALSATMDWLEIIHNTPGHTNPHEFPERFASELKDSVKKLRFIGEHANKQRAVQAWEGASVLYYILHDFGALKVCGEKAVALDPKREIAWTMLLISTMDNDDPDGKDSPAAIEEKLSLCQRKLKISDSQQNHLLMARAYRSAEKWEKAAAEAEIAFSKDTNSLLATINLAAFDLHSGKDEEKLEHANNHLGLTEVLLEKCTDFQEKKKRWRELVLNEAIYLALKDERGSFDPMKLVDKVLQTYPDDEDAKKIKRALE